MQAVPQGKSINLELITKDSNSNYLTPVSTNNLSIIRPNGSVAVSNVDSTTLSPGIERYTFEVPISAAIGVYIAAWSVVLPGGIVVSKDEPFEIVDDEAPYRTSTSRLDVIERGRRVPLDVIFRAGNVRTDADDIQVTVAGPLGESYVLESPVHLNTGVYRSWWNVPWGAPEGIYVVTWSGLVDDETVAREESLEISPDAFQAPNFSGGIGRASLGDLLYFDAIFRSSSGTLLNMDPLPTVLVTDPHGVRISYDNPERIATGTYRKNISLGIPGFWHFDWQGVDEGINASYLSAVEVTESVGTGDGSHAFGASVYGDNGQGGVQSLIPWFEVTERSIPSRWQVGDYIDQIASEVSLMVGDYVAVQTNVGFEGRITSAARYVVELGAAASACDAAHRQMVSPNHTDYGARLWERYNKSLNSLKTIVDEATSGGDASVGARGGWAVSGPPAQFRSGLVGW